MGAPRRGTGIIAITLAFTLATACSRISKAPQESSASPKNAPARLESSQPAYPVQVEITAGSVVVRTSAAEFQVKPDGYVQAFLLKDGNKLSLDEPNVGPAAGSNFVSVAGKNVNFTLDLEHARVSDAVGKMGSGKRIEISARPLGPMGKELHAVLALEVYDNFPNILLSCAEYKNTGVRDFVIEKSVNQRRRFDARLSDPKAHPWELWSFHGASYEWGKDDVFKLKPAFFQPNVMGELVKGGYGGGIPVVAFWTRQFGEALGHVETLPIPASIPARVAADGRVNAEGGYPANVGLKAGA